MSWRDIPMDTATLENETPGHEMRTEERREDPQDRNIRSRCEQLLTLGTEDTKAAENAAVLGYN
jgi:hypothetical protein